MVVDIFNTNNKYDVIYADPPWEYKQSGSKTNSRGMAKQHYDTMPTTEICDLPVRDICTDKTICFMWATFPNISEALKVMKAWGFEYKTAAFVWIKQNKKSNSLFWGMGAYTRANAEVCLLGISKNTRAKEIVKSHSVHQVIQQPIMKHSKKPYEAIKRIETLIGGGSKNRIVCKKVKRNNENLEERVSNKMKFVDFFSGVGGHERDGTCRSRYKAASR